MKYLMFPLCVALASGLLGGDVAAQELPCPGERPEGVPEGYVVIEGDIIVPENHCHDDGTWDTNLWPNGLVPFVFNANVTPANQAQALLAMSLWESVANIDFRPRAAETNFVLIQDSTANNSALGMQGGQQIINLFNWNNTFIIAHELAHTLGVYHEQSRPDRGQYVRINEVNICQTCCSGGPCNSNFDIKPGASAYGPYDFDSVMHYGQFAFTVMAGAPTITVLSPNGAWQSLIGQRTRLSEWDMNVMSFLYPFSNWVFVDQTVSGSANVGTFMDPFISLSLGISAVPSGGTIWVLDSSNYANTGVFTNAMTIKAPVGGVVIGS